MMASACGRGLAAAAAIVLDRPLQVVDGVEEGVAQAATLRGRCRAAPPGRTAASAGAGVRAARRRPVRGAGPDRARRWRRSRCRPRPGAAPARSAAGRRRRGGWPVPARGPACGWRPAVRCHLGLARWRAASSMVSPAPISSTVDSSSRANESCASRTAVDATDTGLAPMRVSVRARLATAKVCWNRRSSWLPSAPACARCRPGLLDLAEDLRLAQHQRIQPGGDPEQVAHGVAVAVPVQVGVQVAPAVGVGGQPVGQRAAVVVGHAYSSVRLQVDSSTASGTPGSARSDASAPGRASPRERHAFAQVHRRGLVVEAEDAQGHRGRRRWLLRDVSFARAAYGSAARRAAALLPGPACPGAAPAPVRCPFPLVALFGLPLLPSLHCAGACRAGRRQRRRGCHSAASRSMAGEFALRPASSTRPRAGTCRPRAPAQRRRPGRTRHPHRAAGRRRRPRRGEALALWRARAPDRWRCVPPRPRWRCAGAMRRRAPRTGALLRATGEMAGGMRWPRWPVAAATRSWRRGAGGDRSTTAAPTAAGLAGVRRPGATPGRAAAGRRASSPRSSSAFPDEPRVALLHASQLRDGGKPERSARGARRPGESRRRQPTTCGSRWRGEYDALGDPATAATCSRAARRTTRPTPARLAAGQAPRTRRRWARCTTSCSAIQPAGSGAAPAARPDRRIPQAPRTKRWTGTTAFPVATAALAGGLRAANVLHELKRGDEAYAELRELQADAAPPTTTRAATPTCSRPTCARRTRTTPANWTPSRAAWPPIPTTAPCCTRARWLGTARRHRPRRGRPAQDPGRPSRTTSPRSTRWATPWPIAPPATSEALELIDRARVAEPDNAAIIDSYGWVLYRLGAHAEALVRTAPRVLRCRRIRRSPRTWARCSG